MGADGMRAPVQTVELLLDEATDVAVRSTWRVLAGAALPSQAQHAGPSNAPHVTVAVRESIPSALDEALGAAAGDLPVPIGLGGLLVFARRRCVLARAVVPSEQLLRLHAGVHEALAGCGPTPATMLPGRWTPHVTLARGLSAEQVGAALAALGETTDQDGTVVAVRRWDAAQRRTWLVPG